MPSLTCFYKLHVLGNSYWHGFVLYLCVKVCRGGFGDFLGKSLFASDGDSTMAQEPLPVLCFCKIQLFVIKSLMKIFDFKLDVLS